MSNGAEVCCVLGICCPAELQEAALVRVMVDSGCPEATAKKAAVKMQKYLNTKAILKAIGDRLYHQQ